MAIPLILLGAATLAGGFGVKKGIDAKALFKSLKTEQLQSQKRSKTASEELEKTINTAQILCEVLGYQKIQVYKNSLIPFVEAFSIIKNVDFNDGSLLKEASLTITQDDMLTLLDISLKMKDVIAAGVGTLGGGGLFAVAIYGGTGLFGGVSAGSAFSAASGAVATNSALAGIGGGAMAAGTCVGGGGTVAAGAGCMAGEAGGMAGGMGMGMGGGAGAMAGAAGGMGMGGGAGAMAGAAGGMGMGGGAGAMAGAGGGMGMCGGAGAMAGAGGAASGAVGGGVVSGVAGGVAGGTVGAVSGGVAGTTVTGIATLCGMVAGPFLAVGGMVLASKAQEAKHFAAINLKSTNAVIEHMKNKQVATEAAFCRVYTILFLLNKLDERFTPLLTKVQGLVALSNDYTSYTDNDKKSVMMAAMMAKTIKNVMETSILDESGAITVASEEIARESERVMQAIAL